MKLFHLFSTALSAILGLSLLSAVWAAESVPLEQLSHFHGIAVNPVNPAELYLATHHGLYLASPDGTAVLLSESQDDLMGFVLHPTKSDVLYASGHPPQGGNLGLITSTDGGKSWQQLSPGAHGPVDFHALTISKADPQTLYGTHGGLQVSHDGGKSWQIVAKLPERTIDLAASSTDTDTLYAATAKGLLVSRDGGRSWQPASLFQGPATLVETDYEGNIYAFVVGTGLLKSKGGANWTRLSSTFGERYLLHLAADPTDPDRLYAVTQNNEILTSQDSGSRWQPWPSDTIKSNLNKTLSH